MSDDTELANAACSCSALHHAHRIAGWIGDGKEVTEGGMPVRADVPDLGRALGVAIPEPVPEAADVAELYRAWTVAVYLELLSFDTDRHVTTGPGVVHWASVEEIEILELWSRAMVATITATLGIEEDEDTAELCELALEAITSMETPPTRAQLCDAIENRVHEYYVDLFEDPDDELLKLGRDTAEALLTEFGAFGAIDEHLQATALGQWGLEAMAAWTSTPDVEMLDALTDMLIEQGVDPTDTGAVERWLEEFQDSADPLAEDLPFDDDDDAEDEDFGTLDLKTAFDLPDSLPPVSLPTEAELAEAARGSELLGKARQLALWIGESRPTNEADELFRSDALEAARALGVDDEALSDADTLAADEDLEGMDDLPELFDLWVLAEVAGFISIGTEYVTPGQDLAEWPDGDDETVLAIWSAALHNMVTHSAFVTTGFVDDDTDDIELDFAGVGIILTVLLFLGRNSGVALAELDEVVKETSSVDLEPDEAERAWNSWIAHNGNPVYGFLDWLARLGAVEWDADSARLSALGLHAVRARMLDSDVAVPVLPPVQRMSATELITAVSSGDERELASFSAAWLATHEPDSAAEQLLAVAADGNPAQRVVATSIVNEIDPAPNTCWQAALETHSLRPYAKIALARSAGLDPDQAGELEPTRPELAWLLADTVASTTGPLDTEEIAEELDQLVVPAPQQAELFDEVWRSGHPHAYEVLTTIGQHHPDTGTAKAARKAAFKAGSSGV